jgi:hypothetical protein
VDCWRPYVADDLIDAPAGRFVPLPIRCPQMGADTARPATCAAGLAVERPAHRVVRPSSDPATTPDRRQLVMNPGSPRSPSVRPLALQPREGGARE